MSFCASDPLFMLFNTRVKSPQSSSLHEECTYGSGTAAAEQYPGGSLEGVSQPPVAEERGTASLRDLAGWLKAL